MRQQARVPPSKVTVWSISITVYSNYDLRFVLTALLSKRYYILAQSLKDMVDDQYRGLLTEREREILRGEADVSDNYRYRVVSRIRTKIDNIDDDVEILAENRQDLLKKLQQIVCDSEKND